MVLCDSFSNNIECVLELTNVYNIKLIILCMMLLYSLIMIYYSNYIKDSKDNYNLWKTYIFKVLPYIYLISVLPGFLMLKHSLSLEIFITSIVGIGFVCFTLFLGLSISYSTNFILKLFGMPEERLYNDNKKYKSTEKKHG